MTRRSGLAAAVTVLLLAIAANTVLSIRAYDHTTSFLGEESRQRVHTVGERCETTARTLRILQNNLPPSKHDEEGWFLTSYKRCKASLQSIEARAGVRYTP